MAEGFRDTEKGIVFNIAQNLEALFFFRWSYPDFHVLFPVQKHTKEIFVYKDAEHRGFIYSGGFDGIIASRYDRVNLGVKTADCLPIIFASEKVKGVIHAGWRGIANGIIDELETKLRIFKEKPENLKVIVGPHICGRCYEVRDDVASIFRELCRKRDIDEDKVILTNNGRVFIDLFSCVFEILNKKGVAEIFHAGICVREDERFFSKRRGDERSQPSCLINSHICCDE